MEYALEAGAALLDVDPIKLWRRLGTVAFEDVGIASSETLTLTVAALSGKRLRAELGGEWAVASFLIRKLAAAPKCRAVDNLLMIADSHASHAKARQGYSSQQERQRIRLGCFVQAQTSSSRRLPSGASGPSCATAPACVQAVMPIRHFVIWQRSAFLRMCLRSVKRVVVRPNKPCP